MIEERDSLGRTCASTCTLTWRSTGLASLFPVAARDGTEAFIRRLRDPSQRAGLEAAVREKIAKLGTWDAVQITSTPLRRSGLGTRAETRRASPKSGEDPYALLVRLIARPETAPGW